MRDFFFKHWLTYNNTHYAYQTSERFLGISSVGWVAMGAISTVFLALVALFGEHLWDWLRRPIITVSFDSQSDRCYTFAENPNDSIEGAGQGLENRRQFFRLKVSNLGKQTIHHLKAKVEIFDVEENRLGERFEPSYLRWSMGVGKEETDLAPGEDSYVSLISQVINKTGISLPLRVELADLITQRAIGPDRIWRPFIFKVAFHADNVDKAVVKFYKFTPSDKLDHSKPGKLEEAQSWE